MPLQFPVALKALEIPQAHRPIVTARQPAAIGTKGDTLNSTRMPLQFTLTFKALGIPQAPLYYQNC